MAVFWKINFQFYHFIYLAGITILRLHIHHFLYVLILKTLIKTLISKIFRRERIWALDGKLTTLFFSEKTVKYRTQKSNHSIRILFQKNFAVIMRLAQLPLFSDDYIFSYAEYIDFWRKFGKFFTFKVENYSSLVSYQKFEWKLGPKIVAPIF